MQMSGDGGLGFSMPHPAEACVRLLRVMRDGAHQVVAGEAERESLEGFSEELADVLLLRYPQAAVAEVSVESHLWKRLVLGGEPSSTGFMKGSAERQTAHVRRARGGLPHTRSGFAEMTVLRTEPHDTTERPRLEGSAIPEPANSLASRALTAEWTCNTAAGAAETNFRKLRHSVRECLLRVFAHDPSQSEGRTLFAMAQAVLEQADAVAEVSLRMMSKQYHLIDLGGLVPTHAHGVFLPAEEPLEATEVTVRRSGYSYVARAASGTEGAEGAPAVLRGEG